MGLARSTLYEQLRRTEDYTAVVEAMHAVKDDFETHDWRRMQAALAQQGWMVNHTKIKRLMREHHLRARRRRLVATTYSDHSLPVFPNRAKDMVLTGPDLLWVADITYIRLPGASSMRRWSWTPGRAASLVLP